MRSNRKDPEYVVVRVYNDSGALDSTFKAQRFDARADARAHAKYRNDRSRTPDRRYRVIPAYPGPIRRG